MFGYSAFRQANLRKSKYILDKKYYDDIVPLVNGTNVTRMKRIALESGVMHWQRAQKAAKDFSPSGSCQKYLLDVVDKEKSGKNEEVRDVLYELDELSGGHSSKSLQCAPPLVPFHNKLVPRKNLPKFKKGDDFTKEMLRIPKTFHFSTKSRCLPKELHQRIERWTQQFPSYSIILHDQDAVARLVNQEWREFPNLQRAVKCATHTGTRMIDIWRVLILYKYGGIYSDIDNWPEEKFRGAHAIPQNVSFFSFADAYKRPSPGFLCASIYHPIMYISMRYMIQNILDATKIGNATGPHVLWTAYKHSLAGSVVTRYKWKRLKQEKQNKQKLKKNKIWDEEFREIRYSWMETNTFHKGVSSIFLAVWMNESLQRDWHLTSFDFLCAYCHDEDVVWALRDNAF